MRSRRAETKHDDVPLPPVPDDSCAWWALPEVPPDWASFLAYLLTRPGLQQHDAEALRGWLSWRVLPRRFWHRVEYIASTLPHTFTYDDWAL